LPSSITHFTVVGQISDVNNCNEWVGERSHAWTNRGNYRLLELWWWLYTRITAVWEFENFRHLVLVAQSVHVSVAAV